MDEMFDKKNFKLIDFEKIHKYVADGKPVYMVMMDGKLVQITDDCDVKVLFSHNLRGGTYAVPRKKSGLGNFTKDLHLGHWSISVSHEEKGGD